MKKPVDEIFGMVTAAVLISLAIQLSSLFLLFQTMIKQDSTEDKKLSKDLKKILRDGKDWKVMVVKDNMPNAFCIIRPYVFISTGLMKMMNERELMSILLHEAGHITNKDIWKDIIVKNSFSAIMLSVVGSIGGPTALIMMIFFYYIIGAEGITNKIFTRVLGRFEENRADSFAVKYGYADDMISVLKKLDRKIKSMQPPCGKICKIIEKIEEILDEHPPVKKRIENILKRKETWITAKNKSFVNIRNMFIKGFGVKKPV